MNIREANNMPNIRVPNSVHKMNGTLRADRHGTPIDIKEALPDAPEFLNGVAREEWQRVTTILNRYDVLRATDYVCLAAYCSLFAELVVNGEEMKAAKMALLRGYINDLGLSPVSRMRFDMKDQTKKEDNEFDNL